MKPRLAEQMAADWQRTDQGLTPLAQGPPRVLMLEVTNHCNLACRFCYNRQARRERGYLSLDLARIALDQARDLGVGELALYSTGEPLLHPELDRLTALGKERGFYTYLTTNGLALTLDLGRRLAEAGLDSLKLSLDAGDREAYRRIKGRDAFDQVLANLAGIREISRELGRPRIICSFVQTRDNLPGLAAFRALAGPWADDLLVTWPVNLGGKVRPGAPEGAGPGERRPCRMLWDRLVVCHDGRLTPCCVDFEAELCFARLGQAPLSELWNHPRLVAWRKAHLAGDLAALPPCRACDAARVQTPERLLAAQAPAGEER
ncbi:MAG: radical SAM protein [Deltaproteobacteria bacterium]|nr:radical SAM protein [Deltaproteobacteria bacterium]